MTAQPARRDVEQSSPAARAGRALQAGAAGALLCVVVARAMMGELPFRMHLATPQVGLSGADEIALRADRGEVARVSFACLLLAAVAVWLTGAALSGRLVVRCGWLAWLIALLAAMTLLSAMGASDKRGAAIAWAEQLAMLLACLLAAQCLAGRRGLFLLAVTLAAVGAVLAAKGLHQVFVEVPEQVADFQAHRQARLDALALVAGSPQARAFESRLRATTPTGFSGLSNTLASMLILCLLAAAGLTAGKLRRAIETWRAQRASPSKGEISSPALAAIVSALLAAAAAVALVLTRSRGGIIAAAVAAVAWAALLVRGRWLADRKRTVVGAVVVLFLLGGAGVIAYGLAFDRLPTKSMTFRWYYWTGAAEIVAKHPVLGVGPGNFPAAYLQYRRAAAEEAVKLPHNSIIYAASQYGLVGGAVFVGLVVAVLIGMCRAAGDGADNDLQPGQRPSRLAWVALGLAAAAAVARGLLTDAGVSASMFLIDAAAPAGLLAAMVLAAGCIGEPGTRRGELPTAAVRSALACGAAGVFLHSMIEPSLSMPGPATMFWVTAGACLGAGCWRLRDLSWLRWPVAAAGVAATAAAVMLLWLPAEQRMVLTESAMRALARGDETLAALSAGRLGRADPWDGYAAADAGAVVLATGQSEEGYNLASQAVSRDPSYYGHARLAGEAAWRLAAEQPQQGRWTDEALDLMGRAVKLNPMDSHLRLQFARMLCQAGRGRQCLEQLTAAEGIDASLNAESMLRFSPVQQQEIAQLRAQAAAGAPSSQAGKL